METRVVGMLSLLAALSAAAQPAITTAPAAADRNEIPVTLILSGGVSLGSYEAGLSWAVTRLTQVRPGHAPEPRSGRVRLVAVTGASAGSINAVLSAALWCVDPAFHTDTSVDNNPLRNTWIPIGLDRLLPDAAARYQQGDALLSSRPLVEAFDRLRDDLLSGTGLKRFTPGCQLPIGVTVTRSEAEEQQVAGLTVRTQRFVLPWLLEVTSEGHPRFVPLRLAEVRDQEDDVLTLAGSAERGGVQELPFEQVAQGLLASAAFPAAFSPRVLCDCSTRCPAAHQETSGRCPGPSGPIDGLTCPARSPRGEPLTLCSRHYVDGGIFDNAPVGLAIDLTETTYRAALLQPVNYLFVDPDLRRLAPVGGTAPQARPGTAGLERVLRLLAELAATGRSSDLSRTIRASGWNRTTSHLLYRTVAALVPFFALNQQLAALATGAAFPPVPEEPKIIPTPGLRAAGGRVLLRCVSDAPAATPRARERVAACAREIRILFADPSATPEQADLSDEEVVQLAQLIASNVDKGLSDLARTDAAERSLGDQQLFIDRLTVGTAAIFILAEELPRVVRGPLPDARLRRFRDSLLRAAPVAEALGAVTAGTANVLLLRQLMRLEATPGLQAVVARTRAILANLPRGDVFTTSDLRPLLDGLARTPDAPAAAVQVVKELAQLGPALQAALNRTNGLTRDASALAQSRGGERALVVSTRFAPIVGSQLANFGAFLDVPLREFDYYAGVYDASHAFAAFLCSASVLPGMIGSVRRKDKPDELDLAAPETQRCLGEALHVVAASLDLQRSPRATLVLRTLARVELAASLDSSAAAAELLREPGWRWLEDGASPRTEDANLGAVAGALLSAHAACSEHSREALCVRDLSFPELIQALQDRGYRPVEHNMQAALADPAAWGRRTARKALDRSLDGQRAAADDGALKGTIQRALGVGELWMRGFTPGASYPRLDLDPSSIPGESLAQHDPGRRLLAHVIPYRIGFDVHEAGISLSWVEPALRLSRNVSLMSEVSPIDYESVHGRLFSTVGLLPTLHVLGTSFSAGPRLSVDWADGTLATGAELRVGFLQDRLAFGVGARDFPLQSRNVFILVSLADLNGTAYWLLPGLGR